MQVGLVKWTERLKLGVPALFNLYKYQSFTSGTMGFPVMLSAPVISDILDDQGWVKNKNMCWSTMVCLPGVPIGTERFCFWMWRRNNRCTPMLDTPWPVGFRSGVGGGPCFSLNMLFSLVQSSHLIESSLHQPFPTEAAALTNKGFFCATFLQTLE